MSTSTLTPGDNKQDDKLNPGQHDYERRVDFWNNLAAAEKKGTHNQNPEKNQEQSTGAVGEDANATAEQDTVRQQESQGNPPWKTDIDPAASPAKQTAPRAAITFSLSFLRKRGGILGFIAFILGGGAAFVGTTGVISMPINLMENISVKNDSASTATSSRFLKVFGFASAGSTDPVCKNSTKKMKCKMGRISNSALKKLEKKGFKAYFDDGTTYDGKKRTGYPKANPKGYTIDLGDGKTANVSSQNLAGFLAQKENRKISAKVLGTGGAFNVRLSTWTGKYIDKKIFRPLGIERKGGIIDGERSADKATSRRQAALKKLRDNIPGLEKLSGVTDGVKAKVAGHLDKSKKGGVGYTLAVAGCIGVKAPRYIAAGVAAVQLAQIIPIINDVILSPGSKIKASGVDVTNAATYEDAEEVGALLTEEAPDPETGEMAAPLDSAILLAAMGVNTSKPAVSKPFTPGYSFLTNPTVIAANKADTAMEPTCNAIMSPAAMYTALAVDSAVTVAASATVVGGIVKVIASLAVTEIAIHVTSAIVGEAAKAAVTDLAENDNLQTAEGKQFGDALGVSAAAFFSAGGMARHLNVLKVSQLDDQAAEQAKVENFQREMDIASLSPFDTSSRHTFLGSIIYNANMTAIASGSYGSSNLLSSALTLAKLPMQGLIPNAGATTNFTQDYCGYAKDFGLETENSANTPAINMSGTPCTGLVASGMATEEAISLIENEGWLDESVSVPDNADPEEMLEAGYIKKDTPLADAMETCGSALGGDYIYNAAGCTVDSPRVLGGSQNARYANTHSSLPTQSCYVSDEHGEICATEEYGTGDTEGVKNPRSLAAISILLTDYLTLSSMNGEDVDTGPTTATAPSNGEVDEAGLFKDSTSVPCGAGTTDAGQDTAYNKGTPIPVQLCALPNTSENGKPAIVNSRASASAFAMFEQMRKDLKLDKIAITDSFRTMAEQQAVRLVYGPQAAPPGYSNHQMGFAFDMNFGNVGYKKDVNTSYPGNRLWEWLKANASKYHFSQYQAEGWHWSINGQ